MQIGPDGGGASAEPAAAGAAHLIGWWRCPDQDDSEPDGLGSRGGQGERDGGCEQVVRAVREGWA